MQSSRCLSCLLTLATTLALNFVSLPTEGAESAEPVESQLTYKSIGDRELTIDWTRPAEWKPSDRRAAVVFFHGGGWVGGKPGQFSKHSKELANKGLVCFRVEYRLLDRATQDPPIICVADASDAIRHLRREAARLGIDPDRIAAAGGSAGGHLAAYLGMMDDVKVGGVSRKPQALVLFNPVYDNGPGEWGHGRVGQDFRLYSPAHNITVDDPPALVMLGTDDELVPVSTAKRFQDAMQAHGLRSELVLYDGQPHGFFNANRAGGEYYRKTMDEMVAFLQTLRWFDS